MTVEWKSAVKHSRFLMGVFVILISTVVSVPTFAVEITTTEPTMTTPPTGYIPGQRGQASSAGEIFGTRRGNWHPWLGISETWTDNIFNDADNEQNESITVINPGIWLAVPARFDRPSGLQTLNTVPGGLPYTVLNDEEVTGLYRLYGSYSANIERYQDFDQYNQTAHKAEGSVGFFPGPKTRIILQDAFDRDREPFSSGNATSGQEDRFKGNVTRLELGYQATPKIGLNLSGSFYTLRYDEDRNSIRERNDKTGGATISWKVLPKSSLLAEYRRVVVDYRDRTREDSSEDQFFLGTRWNLTEKTSGLAKVGYGSKDFEGATSSSSDLLLELQMDYKFSQKTSLNLAGFRQVNESDITASSDRLTYQLALGLEHRLTRKLSGKLDLSWLQDNYNGAITVGSQTDERQDDYLQAGVGLGWNVVRWLTLSCGYNYSERSSNFGAFDYQTNSVYINASAAL